MIRVAVLDDYQGVASGLADWERLDAEVVFFSDIPADRAALVDRLAGFDVVVAMRERTPFPADLFPMLPDLRLLVTTGMRNAAIDLGAAAGAGVTVCGTRSSGQGTAELAFLLIHSLMRRFLDQVDEVRDGRWQGPLGSDLYGQVLGVVGLGRIGSVVAGFGKAFGMDVVAWSENLTDERCAEVGVLRVSKRELLASSDVVTLHLKLSERSRGVIGRDDLTAMKPTAYLVNTSRSPLVDTGALLEALDAGLIAGAGLDVFDVEPLDRADRLRTHPKVLATPHVGYVTTDTYQLMYPDAVEDIAAWMDGDPIRVLT